MDNNYIEPKEGQEETKQEQAPEAAEVKDTGEKKGSGELVD